MIRNRRIREKIVRDFNMVKEWLPIRVNTILDIGCGMGEIDILIQQSEGISKIYLIDGDGTTRNENVSITK